MNINLNEEIGAHFQRLRNLANEAQEDEEQSFSSRASAMSALTSIIKELTKTQEEIINMERLMRIENVTIETVKQFLTPEQQGIFLERLEEMLKDGNR